MCSKRGGAALFFPDILALGREEESEGRAVVGRRVFQSCFAANRGSDVVKQDSLSEFEGAIAALSVVVSGMVGGEIRSSFCGRVWIPDAEMPVRCSDGLPVIELYRAFLPVPQGLRVLLNSCVFLRPQLHLCKDKSLYCILHCFLRRHYTGEVLLRTGRR